MDQKVKGSGQLRRACKDQPVLQVAMEKTVAMENRLTTRVLVVEVKVNKESGERKARRGIKVYRVRLVRQELQVE
jgi:hypothetical protein